MDGLKVGVILRAVKVVSFKLKQDEVWLNWVLICSLSCSSVIAICEFKLPNDLLHVDSKVLPVREDWNFKTFTRLGIALPRT